MRIKYFPLLLIVCFIQKANAQLDKVIPSSPIAKAMEKYGDYPVSIFTGIPDINIPIYEIVSGDIIIPISVSYHSSGFQVNQSQYPVGLGWTLNAGGRISRTVKDKPDEYSNTINGWFDNRTGNAYFDQTALTSYLASTDTDPDLLFYSFGTQDNKSGRFLFDFVNRYQQSGNLVPIFLTESNVKFDYTPISNSGYKQGIQSINLTDDKGRLFKFGTGNNSIETSINGADVTHPYYSSWLLSEIIPASRLQSEKVSFSYISGKNEVSYDYSDCAILIDSISFLYEDYIDFSMGFTVPYSDYSYRQQGSSKPFEILDYHSYILRNDPLLRSTRTMNNLMKYISEIKFKNGRVTS